MTGTGMRRTFRSFVFAGRGLAFAARDGSNLRLQVWIGYTALVAGVLESIGPLGLAAIAIAAGLVIVMEIVNTALEAVVDLAVSEWRADAGRAKDLSAGAVLAASATALIAGVLLLGPGLGRLPSSLTGAFRDHPGLAAVAGLLWVLLGLWWLAGRPAPGGPAGAGTPPEEPGVPGGGRHRA